MQHWRIRLKAERERLGLSQGDVAEKLGVTPASVGHWERGIREPGLEMLERWGNVLGVPVVLLVGGEDPIVLKLRELLPSLDDRTRRLFEAQLDMLTPQNVTKRHAG